MITSGGQPIEGVNVYGSLGKCCPVKREQAITNKDGQFRLEKPGTVIRLYKEGLQPKTLVIQPGTSTVRIEVNSVPNAMNVSDCGPLQQNQKRIGWGRYGLQVTVSEGSFDVQGGKPDVDYTRYVIRSKRGQSFMELWLGPTAISVDPDDDDQFIASVDFGQKILLFRENGVGLDSGGHFQGGLSWRRTAIAGLGGAIYNKVSSVDATSFDQIINSMCLVPYPNK